MDLPSPSAGDALAQPTRARIFGLLGELRRGARTDELADALGLHPNGVRSHLERLHDAGLVVRERERQARGRPRDVWTIAPDARPGGGAPTAYANLGRWLVQALHDADTPAAGIEAAGLRIGRELAGGHDETPREQRFHAALSAMGFQPTRDAGAGGSITYTLGNCPYRDVVAADQQRVCGLHRGMTRGMLETIDPASELVAFAARDPYTAGCLVTVRGPIAVAAG